MEPGSPGDPQRTRQKPICCTNQCPSNTFHGFAFSWLPRPLGCPPNPISDPHPIAGCRGPCHIEFICHFYSLLKCQSCRTRRSLVRPPGSTLSPRGGHALLKVTCRFTAEPGLNPQVHAHTLELVLCLYRVRGRENVDKNHPLCPQHEPSSAWAHCSQTSSSSCPCLHVHGPSLRALLIFGER